MSACGILRNVLRAAWAGGDFGRGPAAIRCLTVNRFRVELVVVLMLATASACRASDTDAVISGVVRDAQGVAQMGALVQVLGANAALMGAAYTDLSGHYRVSNLVPGRYQIRASAVLFSPSIRNNLRLPVGARAVVDMTLTTIFQSTAWIPAERRRADEPTDDWKWTLRAAASRPILRLVEDGEIVMVSSSAVDASRPTQHARAEVSSGDGGFGLGGVHHRLAVDTILEDGADVMVRADVGADLSQPGRAPAANFDAGFERRMGFDGAARLVMNIQSHPEMLSTGGNVGLQTFRMASAQRMKLGDLLDLEYGSALSVMRASETGMTTRPFLRVLVHPAPGWSVGYRMATARDLQDYESLNSIDSETPVAASVGGRLATERGMHQEISLARADGRGNVQFAVYHDGIQSVALSGTGGLRVDDLQMPGVQGLLVDSTTDNFRLLSRGYSVNGVRLTISEPLTASLSMAASVGTGVALSARDSGAVTLQEANDGLRVRSGATATVALKGRILHTGTKIRAAYRWQQRDTVTAVDSYAPFSDQAYCSFYVAQPLRFGGLLPEGLNAVVDVTNLLEQGYQPFLSKDGRTVFLAQSPRVLQAGLSYTF